MAISTYPSIFTLNSSIIRHGVTEWIIKHLYAVYKGLISDEMTHIGGK